MDSQDQSGEQRKPLPQWFKPGQSGNPGGRPKGLRDELTKDFLGALVTDFKAHGKDALEKCREKKPDVYIRCVTALMPKEVEVKNHLIDMTDEQLIAAVTALQSFLLAQAASVGAGDAGQATAAH